MGVVLGNYTNDISLAVKLIVEGRGLIPTLYLDLVATDNASHSTVGGCTVHSSERIYIVRDLRTVPVRENPDLCTVGDDVPVIWQLVQVR